MPALRDVLDDIAPAAITIRPVQTHDAVAVRGVAAVRLRDGLAVRRRHSARRAARRAAVARPRAARRADGRRGRRRHRRWRCSTTILARRRGTAPGTRARSADELAVLIDRARDLTRRRDRRARSRRSNEGRRGDPFAELLERGRAIAIDIPTATATTERRVILTETFARYVAAFGDDAFATVYAGTTLEPRAAADVVPEVAAPFRRSRPPPRVASCSRDSSRSSATISVDDVLDALRVRSRLGRRATRRLDARTENSCAAHSAGAAATPRWASRRLLEQARRRELAQRAQADRSRRSAAVRALHAAVAASRSRRRVSMATTVRRASCARCTASRARPSSGSATICRRASTTTIPRSCRDSSRRASSCGSAAASTAQPNDAPNLVDDSLRAARIRRACGSPTTTPTPPLGEFARRTLDALRAEGASFFDELQTSTSLGAARCATRCASSSARASSTNDTIESMRQVVRWRPFVSPRDRNQPDPTRWLPGRLHAVGESVRRAAPTESSTPAEVETARQRTRRNKATGPDAGRSCARRACSAPQTTTRRPPRVVARQWLERYGVVSREMWRRERPAVAWRAIYHELKRLEFRGEVRRGYFVRGLSGAQFALPEAVELLALARRRSAGDAVVMTASDPANVYSLPQAQDPARDPFVRPRSSGALLVTIDGVVVMIAERRGERIVMRPETPAEHVTKAARALVDHITAAHEQRSHRRNDRWSRPRAHRRTSTRSSPPDSSVGRAACGTTDERCHTAAGSLARCKAARLRSL